MQIRPMIVPSTFMVFAAAFGEMILPNSAISSRPPSSGSAGSKAVGACRVSKRDAGNEDKE